MKILVTGGRGFIGSHFVEMALEKGHTIIDYDKMGYASNRHLPWDNHERYSFEKVDISEVEHIPACDIIVNFAAESHVDNSIKSSEVFVKSNILGVYNLLELVKGKPSYDRPLFFHISTDEVYGDTLDGSFTEKDILKPSNPYSATKASAEMLVLSYARTYGIEYMITRSSNNYGERQFEEKLIPKCISSIQSGKSIPIHGDGSYVRDWTYVKDNVSAIFALIESGCKNDIFNIAAENHMTNLQVAEQVIDWFGEGKYEFVENRWGQDLRYSVSSAKLREKTGWKPVYESGLHKWF